MADGTESRVAPVSPELAFFGRITASVTHELNNVLSIVEQAAGLLEDQLAANEHGVPLDPDRLRTVHSRIERQVERGAGIIHNLNRFSHTVDDRDRDTDLGEFLATLRALCERLAELRHVTLEVVPCASTVLIRHNPFAVLQALFRALEIVLDSAQAGETVRVEALPAADRVTIRFTGPASGLVAHRGPHLETCRSLLAEMDGELGTTEQSGGGAFEILLPATVVADHC
ncbi:MAG: hypothetical protein MAG453_01857 [Calditrichaeota bacterium]|nr:hypothetical protein [Calditrichota bacterium]